MVFHVFVDIIQRVTRSTQTTIESHREATRYDRENFTYF